MCLKCVSQENLTHARRNPPRQKHKAKCARGTSRENPTHAKRIRHDGDAGQNVPETYESRKPDPCEEKYVTMKA
ncbi:hypothetical protein GW17_00033437 [Ensete ventricosum]|nr:hypothetical protein GW17_00033437 [Ensete ventricosum]